MTDALLVAVITAGIFLFAYCAELGYAITLGIPYGLINVAWVNTILVIACIWALLAVWLLVGHIALFLFPTYRFPALNAAVGVVLIALFIGLQLMRSVAVHDSTAPPPLIAVSAIDVWVGILVIVAARVYIWPLLSRSNRGKRYSERVAATINEFPNPENVRRWIRHNPFFFPATVFVFGVLVFFALGAYIAQTETEFYVTPTSPESVLLAEYGDTFVFEHFDRKTKKLQGGIIVMKLADGSPLTLEREYVGPLRASDEK